MIRLSRAARLHISTLVAHYDRLDRPEAVRNLRGAIARASDRIAADHGSFFDAPHPYPALARKGWRWTKEGSYWVAFTAEVGGIIVRAVFHESADIPNRL